MSRERNGFLMTTFGAVCACGFGLLIIPRLWPAANAMGWLLPIGPTLIVLLIGFDRIRHRFARREFHKQLFGRVPLLGTAIVVGWMTIAAYEESWLVLIIFFSAVISMGVMGAASFVYALIREPRPEPGPGYLPCPGCGYRIDNIPGPHCPECGRRFVVPPDDWTPSALTSPKGSTASNVKGTGGSN